MSQQSPGNHPQWDSKHCKCENNGDYCDYCLSMLCPECEHHAHDGKVCEVEPGDRWVEGNNCGGWVARPPCGCKSDGKGDSNASNQ